MVTVATLFSCSSDDGGETPPLETYNYFPATSSSVWNYDYVYTSADNTTQGNVPMSVNGEENVGGSTYQVLSNSFYLTGLMEKLLFKKNGDNLTVLIDVETPFFNETLGNLTLIDQSITAGGTILSEISQSSLSEEIIIPTNEYGINGTVQPVATLSLSSHYVERTSNVTVNGESYDNVYKVRVDLKIAQKLEIDLTTGPGFSLEHQLIEPQKYGELNVWFADEVGIIKTNYDYSFENLNVNTNISIPVLGDIDILQIAPELANINSFLNVNGNTQLTSYSL